MLKHIGYAIVNFITIEIMIIDNIIAKTIREILRKYRSSSFVSGFSGVSSGQRINMTIEAKRVKINVGICILNITFDLTHKRQIKIDVVLIISHFNSLEACIPPAYLLIN